MSEQYDIFVSYAHVDNACMPGETQGWVSALMATLEVYLQQKLGRRESYSIWRDPELPGNVPLTPEILDAVRHASILLLVLSPGYVASRWCMQELETFLVQHPVEEGRIFVVERTLLPQRLPALADLKGFPFWVPDREQKGVFRTLGTPTTADLRSEYFRQAEDLAIQLVERIQGVRAAAKPPVSSSTNFPINASTGSTAKPAATDPSIAPPANTSSGLDGFKATIYLAPVSDTLEMERADMVRFFTQHKIRILPASNRVNISSFHQDMEAALGGCSHFIQLLDSSSNMGIPLDQHLIADNKGISILQWRSPETDLAEVQGRDPQQAGLLQGKHVMASNLVEFQQYVLQKILPPPPPVRVVLPPQPQDMIIFVNAGTEDLPLAEDVFQQLTARGYFCLLPLVPSPDMSPSQIRTDLEQNLLECDVMLVLYANSPVAQVRSHLLQGMRMRSRRPADRPLHTAVCVDSQAAAQPLNAGGAGLDVLACSAPFSGRCIEQFLASRGVTV